MRRRLKIALLVAVAILGGTTVLIVGGALVLLRTDWGNEKIRGMIEARAQAALGDRGRALLGGLTLSPLGTVSLDTLEIRDDTGALVLASGPVSGVSSNASKSAASGRPGCGPVRTISGNAAPRLTASATAPARRGCVITARASQLAAM